MHVTGRTDNLLTLPARGQGTVTVTSLSFVAAIEETTGVYRIQVIHRALDELEIRLQG
jgi:hypothetical protein